MKRAMRTLASLLVVLAMVLTMIPAVLAADVYTVAGDAGLCGASWDPTQNAMTLNEETGLYEITFNDVLPGNYGFKITNGSWASNWGQGGVAEGENIAVALPGDETQAIAYKVTITFNPETKIASEMHSSYAAELTFTVAGEAGLCGVDWVPAQNKMTRNAETGLYEITFSGIEAGTYQFKVTDGSWSNSWGKDGGSDNMTVTLEETGDVTIAFNANSKNIAVSVQPQAPEVTDPEVTQPEVTPPQETEPETPATKYTVAGEAGLCGEDWSLSDCPMTETSDGVWEITFSDVAPGWYKFKVTDGSWDNCWGGGPNADGDGNYVVEVAALSDVTVTFHADTKEITTSVVPTGEEVSEITYTVAGDEGLCGTNWDPAQNPMAKNTDGLYEITFTDVAAGIYGFKITEGKWAPGHEWPTENYQVTVSSVGNVTICFNADTKEITVSVADAAPVERTVKMHFLPEGSWGKTTNVWLWGLDGGDLPGYEAYHKNWPGKAIDANPEHEGWYDMTVVTDRAEGFYIIFNDGSHQTSDLYSGQIHADTELWFIGGTVYASAPEAWTGVPTYTYTVHYENTGAWENVNAYAWVDADQFLGGWAGKPTSANKANAGWEDIKFTVPYNAVSIIFNGTGGQTADLAIAASGEERNVEVWVSGGNVAYSAPEGWAEGPSGNTVKIHFMPPKTSWGEKINAWIWAGNGDVPGYEAYHKNWPGKTVEADPNNPGWYYLEVTTELSSFSFIFNGNGRQTKDLSTGVITGDMEIWVFGNQIFSSIPATNPATGDNSNVILYAVMCCLSALAMAAVIGKKKLVK